MEHQCFLLRNLDKVREWRDRQKDRVKQVQQQQQQVGRTRRFMARPCAPLDSLPAQPESLPKAVAVKEEADAATPLFEDNSTYNEEIVRCRCRLFDDEGLMVQCDKCETWQHSDCLGADKAKIALEADNYVCDTCLGIPLTNEDLNIVLVPQPENPPEGLRYYLSLCYKDLQVRQGDCVYVLRDHDTPDSERILWNDETVLSGVNATARPPRRPLPLQIKLPDLDIFQIERMWIDENGKQYVWGHHFLRPHETFHEPSRKFYVNEVLHVPIYEAIPIWAVAGRCWVLDPTTFCKGRPIDVAEEHIYICEYRVDKTARLFAKVARSKFPVCTRPFAFRSFLTRLKPQRTYQPHGPPAHNGRGKSIQPTDNPSQINNKKKDKIKEKKKKETPSAVVTLSTKAIQGQVKVNCCTFNTLDILSPP